MLSYRTPGVYFERVERRPSIGPLRTDIAGFVGYAERGPLFVPVKISDARQFASVFGDPLPYAHLGFAINGYFENGGVACYVVRVAHPEIAQEATIELSGADEQPSLRLRASHGTVTDPTTGEPRIDEGHPILFPSPGRWGNRLSVTIEQASMGTTRTDGPQPSTGESSLVRGLSGFGRGSVVHLRQPGMSSGIHRMIVDVEPQRRELVWDAPITGLDLAGDVPIQLSSVEFTLLVFFDGQLLERHSNLSPVPVHERFVVRALQEESRLIDAEIPESAAVDDWRNPDRWPLAPTRVEFRSGHDGLATVDKDDHLAALEALAAIDDVSVLADPDAVNRPELPTTSPRAVVPLDPCQVLEPPLKGRIFGVVQDSGTREPLAGVTVEFAGASARTDREGVFKLENLQVQQGGLFLRRAGYHDAEILVTPAGRPQTSPTEFHLNPITLPHALGLDDIFDIQSAMLRQGENGLYRVALIDPPQEMLSVEDVQTWRARFDSSYGALYYPWLLIDVDSGPELHAVPPSGFVAGVIARTDLRQGVHHAPANSVLNGVKAVTTDIDEVTQGTLNPPGINCIRTFPGRGIRVYGARTVGSDPELRFLNVRRLLLMIEEAIEDSTQWAVFEPHSEVLRQVLTFTLNSFLDGLWRQGALAGTTRGEAFRVTVDSSINPPDVIDAGQVIAQIEVAPTRPLEFIKFRLGRTDVAVEIRE